MFLIHLLPLSWVVWVVSLILFAGVAITLVGIFFKLIPTALLGPFAMYQLPIQIVGTILLVAGVYLSGGVAIEKEWQAKLALATQQVKIAEEKARTANAVIQEKVVQKIVHVKDKQKAISEKLPDYVTPQVDAGCKITDAVVQYHDAAAKNNPEALN